MASISLLSAAASPFSICSSPSMFPLSPKRCQPSKHSKPRHLHVSKVECNGNPATNSSGEEGKADHTVGNRRDVLIGFGGLCGAATLNNSAMAAPIPPPNLESCSRFSRDNCCPPVPKSSTIIDFQFPPHNYTPHGLRVRPAAHLVNREYIAKYEEAVKRMKDLPHDDPRSFMQQANVHCAYCEGYYDQLGFPDVKLQVHCSWLFFPFHRWYLYFYERILGSLIGDPTFALPFWNWDHPDGMKMPSIYTNEYSPLYDPSRKALPGAVADLDNNQSPPDHDHEAELIKHNLMTMYKQVVSLGKLPSLFLGSPYRAGCAPNPGAGSLEQKPHNTVHIWTGGDLDNFSTAGRDPIFFAHHANVDRMWNIWKTKVPCGKRRDFTDPDWLESSFLFYDENGSLVRVKVKDCLDTTRMGYAFQEVDIPWLNKKPQPRYEFRKSVSDLRLQSDQIPFILDRPRRVILARPLQIVQSVNGTEEVLVIDIDCDNSESTKFDVYINDQGDHRLISAEHTEFAGSFVSLSHSHNRPRNILATLIVVL